MNSDDHLGWYRRNRLPHFDAGEVVQFITFRLGDSLPKSALAEIKEDLKGYNGNLDEETVQRMEAHLDRGLGSCVLRNREVASLVQSALLFHDGAKYDLRAWVIMPNHVHFLARFGSGQSLPKALHSLKSYTANEIRKLYSVSLPVWQESYFDRFIRNDQHYGSTVHYIHQNPCKAGLCKEPEEFEWSSAYASNETT